jgi:Spy/CpxP family protein refolding chaperone
LDRCQTHLDFSQLILSGSGHTQKSIYTKDTNMKRTFSLITASMLLATSVWAQPYGMGAGMMGGYGGAYGMGPGTMGAYGGGYGVGPGMMGGDYSRLNLSADQRQQLQQIQQETQNAMWELMRPMHPKGMHMDGMFGWGPFDEQEARKAYQASSEVHRAMFELQLEARKRSDAVLTPEQREQMRRPSR